MCCVCQIFNPVNGRPVLIRFVNCFLCIHWKHECELSRPCQHSDTPNRNGGDAALVLRPWPQVQWIRMFRRWSNVEGKLDPCLLFVGFSRKECSLEHVSPRNQCIILKMVSQSKVQRKGLTMEESPTLSRCPLYQVSMLDYCGDHRH